VLLSLSAGTAGCAGRSPWNFSGKPDLPPPVSASAPDTNSVLAKLDGKPDHSFASPSLKPPAASGAKKPVVGGTVGSAVASAFAKTKDALTIKPKVISAPDPLSLSSPASDVGPELHLASARMYESQGNPRRAEELYQKALAEAPNDLNILVHYARMHDRNGNLDAAAELYRRAIAAHPKESAAYNDLGLCYARQDRIEDSIKALRQAVQLQPASVLYRNNLATVLVNAGRNDEALSELVAVHGAAVGHYNLAYLLYKDGRVQEASHYLRRALEHDPQLAQAQRLLAMIDAPAAHMDAQHAAHENSPANTFAPASDLPLVLQQPGLPPMGLPAHSPPGSDWGDPPTPDSLPQLLPPVQAM
jgi:Tfp pilus assembly protein PilF